MDRRIYIDNVLGLEYATPRQMIDILRRTYCGTFAVEFMHISDPEEKSWIQQRIEGKDKEISFTPQGKRAILKKLVEAEAFERLRPYAPQARVLRDLVSAGAPLASFAEETENLHQSYLRTVQPEASA